jgi:hypothetical protein
MNDYGKLLFIPINPYVCSLFEWLIAVKDLYPYNPAFCSFFEWMIAVNCFLARLLDLYWMNDCGELLFIPYFGLLLNEWLRWTAFYPLFWAFIEWMIAVNCFLARLLDLYWMNDCGELLFTPSCGPLLNERFRWTAFYHYDPVFLLYLNDWLR